MVEGNNETQLTSGKYIASPKWSRDGQFIAYAASDKDDEQKMLYIYDVKKKENYQPYPIEVNLFRWSPITNQLAYTSRGVLNITKSKGGRPYGFENVSLGVSDFEWFPNGKAFIASSNSNLLPTGWEPVRLFKIAADANLNPNKIKPFYTIQTNMNDLFAINAEIFKWSADGKWVSLLATPTASWSNDSNTLIVLSSVGDQFQVVGKMLINENWIKWSPKNNQLAFISGEGRFFVENKHAAVTDIPIKGRKEYTPKGYVDLDIEWLSQNEIIVARARENKEWKVGPVPTMFTTLYVINIKTGEQNQLSFPKSNQIDQIPQVVGSTITWFRTNENGRKGDVWIKEGGNGRGQLWLRNVDMAPILFK